MSRNESGSAFGPRRRENAQTPAAKISDIYEVPFEDRQLLGAGLKVEFLGYRRRVVTDMPLALFRAFSTRLDRVTQNTIQLP
jgi:hypothetical protein